MVVAWTGFAKGRIETVLSIVALSFVSRFTVFNPASIPSKITNFEFKLIICIISENFLSPPEKPTFISLSKRPLPNGKSSHF